VLALEQPPQDAQDDRDLDPCANASTGTPTAPTAARAGSVTATAGDAAAPTAP
jgi:hypothetical protein